MPRLFNPQRKSEPVTLADGTTLHIRAKARIYIAPDKMTGVIWGLVKAKKLVNRGGDPAPVAPIPRQPAPPPKLPALPPKLEVKSDTSSGHHQSRASVSSKSTKAASAKKEQKADKKQAGSETEPDTKAKVRRKTKSDSADSKSKRSRRRKKVAEE